MTRLTSVCLSALAAVSAGAVCAAQSETITYTYDARGRLIKVVNKDGVNDNLKIDYTLDKVDNRIKVTTTGAPSQPAPPSAER